MNVRKRLPVCGRTKLLRVGNERRGSKSSTVVFAHKGYCSSEASPVDIESVKCIVKVGDCALAQSGR